MTAFHPQWDVSPVLASRDRRRGQRADILWRGEYRIVLVDGVSVVRTSGLPRQIPGVPPARNLHGVSFAVANATAFAAKVMEGTTDRTIDAVLRSLGRRRP